MDSIGSTDFRQRNDGGPEQDKAGWCEISLFDSGQCTIEQSLCICGIWPFIVSGLKLIMGN